MGMCERNDADSGETCSGGYWGDRCPACEASVNEWAALLTAAGCERVGRAQTGGGCGALEGFFRGHYIMAGDGDAGLPTGGVAWVALFPTDDDPDPVGEMTFTRDGVRPGRVVAAITAMLTGWAAAAAVQS